MSEPRTLPELLRQAATLDQAALVYVGLDGGEERQTISGLAAEAEVVLGGLLSLGLSAGDFALMVLPSPRTFLPVFWACQLGRIIPVPVGPPTSPNDSDALRKLHRIWRQLDEPLVLTDPLLASMAGALPDLEGVRFVSVDDLRDSPPNKGDARPDPSELAFLQYTSGSTGRPLGVRVLHRNVIANIDHLCDHIDLGPHDIELGFVPLFHDLGLIGTHLMTLARGATQVRMEILHFLTSPLAWLELTSTHRATVLSGTNTSLRLVLRRLAAADAAHNHLDLSAVTRITVGAEPTDPAVIEAFETKLGAYGLRRHTIQPSYGLAEACLGVTSTRPWAEVRTRHVMRRCVVVGQQAELIDHPQRGSFAVWEGGEPARDQQIRIVDDTDKPLPDGTIGHIQFRGPNATDGYHRDPIATAAAKAGAWLRTGDIGFVEDNHLYPVGRVKEVIFAGGRNLFPHDIEAVASEVDGIRRAVACSTQSGDERTLLFVVVQGDWADDPARLDAVVRRVQRVMGLSVDHLLPIAGRAIPRTSSGKIRRRALAEQFLDGTFSNVDRDVRRLLHAFREGRRTSRQEPALLSPDALSAAIARVWGEVLERDPATIGFDDTYGDLGGTSVQAADILRHLEEELDLPLGQELLIRCATMAEMAEFVRERVMERRPPAGLRASCSPDPTSGQDGRKPARGQRSIPTESQRSIPTESQRSIPTESQHSQRGEHSLAPDRSPRMAIVAASCRLPGANTIEALWALIRDGRNAIGPVPAGRWPGGVPNDLPHALGGFLADPFAFDPAWFALSEQDARHTDPQQRILLELALETLERAGWGAPRRHGHRIGVFIGAGHQAYLSEATPHHERAAAWLANHPAMDRLAPDDRNAVLDALALRPDEGDAAALVGNLINMTAARIAHELDLTGPVLAVHTACSSSLVALHLASRSLANGECDAALVGGIHLNLWSDVHRSFQLAGALSPTGRCRPLGAGADGIVPAEGAALFFVRPLEAARRDGDPLLGVVSGTAVNNDGRSMGIMAPNPAGQRAAIETLYACTRVDRDEVRLIEAHATGTPIGDPVEVRSLSDALGHRVDRWIGTAKSNFGHLFAAAGAVGLLKAALALRHQTIPPSLYATPSDPRLRLDERGLHVPTEAIAWQSEGPRRVQVDAFGFGGTNSVALLEEAGHKNNRLSSQEFSPHLALPVLLSAPDTDRLHGLADALADWVSDAQPTLAEVGVTTAVGRTSFPVRRAGVFETREALVAGLRALAIDRTSNWISAERAGRESVVLLSLDSVPTNCGSAGLWPAWGPSWPPARSSERDARKPAGGQRSIGGADSAQTGEKRHPRWVRPPRVVFVFPGQGAQHPHQGAGLRTSWPDFRRHLDVLVRTYDPEGRWERACYGDDANDATVERTDVAQPLLLAYQLAMARAVSDLGLRPVAVVGHSVGELAASVTAGAIDEADAFTWVIERGRRMAAIEETGGMLAVMGATGIVEQVERLVARHADVLAVAAYNSPRQVVISGVSSALRELSDELQESGALVRELHTSHAFHSPVMAPIARALEGAVVPPAATGSLRVPMASTLLGRRCDSDELTDEYWVDHILKPVRFADAVDDLEPLRPDVYLELGPGNFLARLLADRGRPSISLGRAPTSRDLELDWRAAMAALATLWVNGAELNWHNLTEDASQRRTDAPVVAFLGKTLRLAVTAPAATRDEKLHLPVWVPVEAPSELPRFDADGPAWIVVGEHAGLLADAFRGAGATVVQTSHGESFSRSGELAFTLDTGRPDQLTWLLDAFARRGIAGLVFAPDGDEGESLIDRLHAVATAAAEAGIRLHVVTHLGAPGEGTDAASTNPAAAALRAGTAAFFAETPRLAGFNVDLDENTDSADLELLVSWISQPEAQPHPISIRKGVTLRRGWTSDGALASGRLASVPLARSDERPRWPQAGQRPAVPQKDAWLIFGGSGGVGGLLVDGLVPPDTQVVIAGRRAESAVTSQLDRWGSAGVDIHYRSVDLTSAADVAALVNATKPDVVIHAAGSASPGSFLRSTSQSRGRVLRPKLVGTEALAAALEPFPSTRVLLVSSAAGLDGRLGRALADYAAANAFQDAVAHRERARGRLWTAIDLPVVRGVGLGGGDGAVLAYERLGYHAIEGGDVIDGARSALGTTLPQLVVAPANDVVRWGTSSKLPTEVSSKRPISRASSPDPAIAAVKRPDESREPQLSAVDSDDDVADQSKTWTRAQIEAVIRQQVAQALDILPDEVDPDASFPSMGLDSLATVDLVREVEGLTGLELSLTLLFEHDTIRLVLDYLERERSSSQPESERAQDAPSVPATEEKVPTRPLTGPQKTFFANQGFYPEMPGYIFMRVIVRGGLDPDLLERALAHVLNRHPMLRTAYRWSGAGPVQQTIPTVPAKLERHYLDKLDDPARAEALAAIDSDVRNRVMPLDQPPLVRLTWCRLDLERSALLLNVHHIAGDAWSTQIVMQELLTLHEAWRRGEESPLPHLQTSADQLTDAIAADELTRGERSRSYWAEALRGAPTSLPLPFDGVPDAEPIGPCDIQQVSVPAAEVDALRERARQMDATLFDLLLASYALALERWSGQSDVLVRVANARRTARLPDVERLVGSFADSLPVRIDLSGARTLRDLIRTTRRANLEALDHPFTSSTELAGLSSGRPTGGPRGITPAGLSFPDFPAPERVGELQIEAVRAGAGSGISQLGLVAWRFADELMLSWNTRSQLFETATVSRLADEHLALLHGIASARPEQAIESLRAPEALPDQPSSRRPTVWQPLPETPTIPVRVRLAAEAHPRNVALVEDGAGEWSYRALQRAADRLAHGLATAGIGQGDRVGILADPGFDATVGLLGILGSGAAYVPLVPDQPEARLEQIATQAEVSALVTTPPLASRAVEEAWARSIPAIFVVGSANLPNDSRLRRWDALPDVDGPAATVSEDDIAYIMYTSGTTGSPKGVVVTHRAVSIFHDWVHRRFEVTADDRFIQTSSLGFGGSIRQVYSPLLAGARIVPAPRGLARDPFALIAFLERHRITIWNSVPSLCSRLLDCVVALDAEGRETSLSDLRYVLLGGEKVPPDLARRWFERFGRRHRLVNLYGSTETVVNATSWEMEGPPGPEVRHVPIGRAREGSEVHVLDERMTPVAPGAAGMLYVGGPSIASKYWNAPDVTAETFVDVPGMGRLVRTGDQVRRDSDGVLTYLGRADSQVQVHGNRVELAEIESVLGTHPDVREAAVIAEDDGVTTRLLAWVEPQPDRTSSEAVLRSHVAEFLPHYMVPHRIRELARLPRTIAGKLDRRALANNDGAEPSGRDDEEPAPDERYLEAVVEVWKAVLRRDAIAPDDDFFVLGGDSILALDVLTRLRDLVPAVPRPLQFYAERTARQLAGAIADASKGRSDNNDTTSIGTNEIAPDATFPLLPAQAGFLLGERLVGEGASVWCADLAVAGPLDPTLLRAAAGLLAQRHEALRTVTVRDGLRTRQRVLPTMVIPVETLDVTNLGPTNTKSSVDRARDAAIEAPIDLSAGPAIALTAIQIGRERWRLLVRAHHAMVDGWSLRTLGRELIAIHEALRAGRVPDLGTAALSYRALVSAIVGQTADDADHRYWADQFAEPRPAWSLPMASGAHERATVEQTLPASVIPKLRTVARSLGTTPNIILETLFVRAIARAASCTDLTVGTAISGRDVDLPGAEAAVGCFVTNLPLRVSVAPNDRPADDIASVASAFGDMCRHGSIPPAVLMSSLPTVNAPADIPGRRLTFSFLELGSGVTSDGEVAIDLSTSRFHFASDRLAVDVTCVVVVGETMSIRLHGRAASNARDEILDGMLTELGELLAPPDQVDAALVCYLPARDNVHSLVGLPDVDISGAMTAFFPGGEPLWAETTTTALGSSASVFVPLFADNLTPDAAGRVAETAARAVWKAAEAGADIVSLAGMIPALTGYGARIAAELAASADGRPLPKLTTGHSATVVAVVATVREVLARVGEPLDKLHVAVVGYGSIGQAALGLLVDTVGHPNRLTIIDQPPRLASIEAGLSADGFSVATGPVDVRVEAATDRPPKVDLLIGAISGASGWSVDALPPCTIVVDDSFPPIFETESAVARVRTQGDVLVLGGGLLHVPGRGHPSLRVTVPSEATQNAFMRYAGYGLPGCRVEPLMLLTDPSLEPTIGLVSRTQALAYWLAAERFGLRAAPLHCGATIVEDDWLQRFVSRRRSPRPRLA